MKKGTILLLTNEFPPDYAGGMGVHCNLLAEGLAEAGHRVIVVTPSPFRYALKSTKITANLTVIHAYPPAEAFSPVDTKVEHQRIIADYLRHQIPPLLRHETIDLIHNHDWHLSGMALFLQQDYSIPLVNTFHSLQYMRSFWGESERWPAFYNYHIKPLQKTMFEIERELCERSTTNICVSKAVKNILDTVYTSQEPNKNVVVYNGIDTQIFDRFRKKSTQENYQSFRGRYAQEDETIILFAGRFIPQKGLQYLNEIIKYTSARVCHIRFLIAGKGECLTDVLSVVRNHRNVTYLGFLELRELYNIYNIADIFLMPSLYEPFGLTAVEAMASGTIPIVSRIHGLTEIIDNGKTGITIPPIQLEFARHIDIVAFGEAIIKLATDRSFFHSFDLTDLRNRAEQFDYHRSIQKTIEVYQCVQPHS